MASFRRQTSIRSSLEQVWSFHSTIEGLERLTPSMADLRVEALRLPEGSTGSELVEGSEIDLSIRPIPLGPRIDFTSVIVERESNGDEAYFVDEMRDGPIAEWRHVHSFRSVRDKTLLEDRITYRTGYGPVLDQAFKLGLTAAFADRHRRTREILAQA